jgi:hypothetical protein
MWIAAHAVVRDPQSIATEQPALWRDIRRFNLPVKLALAAAHRVAPALAAPAEALLVALAPCRPGSPELNKITKDLDVGFDDPARAGALRVNPIYTLHAVDNLALSALSLALGNRRGAMSFGGAAGQAWAALEYALEREADALVFGADQSQASWNGSPDPDNEVGVAIALTRDQRDARARIVEITRGEGDNVRAAVPHAGHGLVRWLAALHAAPEGRHAYAVPASDGDSVDEICVIAEVV